MRRKILWLLFLSFVPAPVFSQAIPVHLTLQTSGCEHPRADSAGGPYKDYCRQNVIIGADGDVAKRISAGDWNEGRWCLEGDQVLGPSGSMLDATFDKGRVRIAYLDAKGKRHKATFRVAAHHWEDLPVVKPVEPFARANAPTSPGK